MRTDLDKAAVKRQLKITLGNIDRLLDALNWNPDEEQRIRADVEKEYEKLRHYNDLARGLLK